VSAIDIVTHGCRLNIAESEAIRASLSEIGSGETGDLVIVNSCAVTAEAVATARKAIRRARRERPEARIVVTGCAAEVEPEMFRAMAEVDAIVPNGRKLDASLYRNPGQRPFSDGAQVSQWIPAFAGMTGKGGAHARAFLPVQNGCDHRCTFCIIPFGRGPSRSLAAGAVVDQVRAAVEAGHKEVVLTGVDLTAYGADLPGAPSLGRLVERILTFVPDLPRLRLSSLDPCEVDTRLERLIAGEPRLMPHLHLSLQAGDDMILKRMKRRHNRADAIALVQRLKALRPDLAIGADLIAGFPTEDDFMFANSLALIDECDIVFAHIFPYSPRAGTPAARMPQVDPATIRARAARLREAGARRRAAWLKDQVGTIQSMLVELDGRSGHAANFARVSLADPMPARTIAQVRIIAVDGDILVGVPA
jgi:threonylcarbamoyladenosine tRNA methylthiotransferase MtaB